MIAFTNLGSISLFLALISIPLGCSSHKNNGPAQRETMRHKIYVESIVSKEIVSDLDEVEVKVKGNLPSPAYTFERFKVNVQGKIIEITPLVQYDASKMAAQVLVPFEEVCRIGKLEPGKYEIQIVGEGEHLKKVLEVRKR